MIFLDILTKRYGDDTYRCVLKIDEVAKFLGVDDNWLIACMAWESAWTLDPSKQNSIGATGLIQFMPSTAKGLGTTTDALAKMDFVEQMDWVQKYLGVYKGKYHEFIDLYLAIFWPSSIGKPDDYKIGNALVAKENPAFDPEHTEQITKASVRAGILKNMPKEYLQYLE